MSMAKYLDEIKKWPTLANGLHYKWLVDYPAFSAFGTFELSNEEWENRDFIVNFKGNSELTTEIDHQVALQKATQLVTEMLKDLLGNKIQMFTLSCVPASRESSTKRRFEVFCKGVCEATGMENAYSAFSYTHQTDEDGDLVDTLHIAPEYFKGKKVVVFDDIIASGGSLTRFTDKLIKLGADVVAVIVLGKKISDGYDQNKE